MNTEQYTKDLTAITEKLAIDPVVGSQIISLLTRYYTDPKNINYRRDLRDLIHQRNDNNQALITLGISVLNHYVTLDPTTYFDDVLALLDAIKPTNHNTMIKAISALSQPAQPIAPKPVVSAPVTKPQAPKEKPLMVQRRGSGAMVGDQYLTETIVRKLDLKHGDLVTIEPSPKSKIGIITVVGHDDRAIDPYYNFNFAIVDKKDGHFVISRSFTEDFKINGVAQEVIVTDESGRLGLHDGSIVNYTWPKGNYPLEYLAKGKVNWVYPNDELTNTQATPTRKAKSAHHEFHANLNFDLKGRKVAVIGWHEGKKRCQEWVSAHNGTFVDSMDSKHSTGNYDVKLDSLIAKANLVVVITAASAHHDSISANLAAKKHNVPYAVSNTTSPLAFEKALYRAANNLPAYEAGGVVVEYPIH